MPDKKNSSHSIAALGQGGLGLPDKDYYLSDDADRVEIREKYRAHVAAMLLLVGGEYVNPDAAKAGAEGVIKLETAVASAHLTPAERRDAERQVRIRRITAKQRRVSLARVLRSVE